MNWNSVKRGEHPQETGNYIASIRRDVPGGQYVFSDLAHYDADAARWYKYDPFDSNYEPKEDITAKVVGWTVDVPTFMG